VDDAIVVVENTMRIMDDEGLPPKEAASKAMHQVGGAVVATTLVLLAVFVPPLVMPGLTGRLYVQFATTISVATLFSSLSALTLSPALAGMLLRPTREQKKGRFFTWFEKKFDLVTKGYMGIIHRVLRKGGAMMAAFAVMLCVTGFDVEAQARNFLTDLDAERASRKLVKREVFAGTVHLCLCVRRARDALGCAQLLADQHEGGQDQPKGTEKIADDDSHGLDTAPVDGVDFVADQTG